MPCGKCPSLYTIHIKTNITLSLLLLLCGILGGFASAICKKSDCESMSDERVQSLKVWKS